MSMSRRTSAMACSHRSHSSGSDVDQPRSLRWWSSVSGSPSKQAAHRTRYGLRVSAPEATGDPRLCEACGQKWWPNEDDPEVWCLACRDDIAAGLTLEQAMDEYAGMS